MIRFLIAGDVVMAAVTAWKFKMLPSEVPLFYYKPWGEEQVADIWFILLIPILIHLMYFSNIYLSKKLAKDEPVIQKLFLVANSIVIFGLTSIFVRIILLIT
ncbi:MAG: hypothetical protein O3B87_00370 [bacterium]|nr:hypothetical protein [bacterium]